MASAAALLALAAGIAVPAAAQAGPYVSCPSTDAGFLIGSGPSGASGADTGTLYREVVRDDFHSTCSYRGRYWIYSAGGSGTSYPGTSCTWKKDIGFIGPAGPRYGVSCP